MKKLLFSLLLLLPLLATVAQERKPIRLQPAMPRQTEAFTLPDSLAHMSPWKPDSKVQNPITFKPAVSMTSLVVIPQNSLPKSVTVINNNTLRVRAKFSLSNGQAWNWSPFPDAFLDARTLSVPLPR